MKKLIFITLVSALVVVIYGQDIKEPENTNTSTITPPSTTTSIPTTSSLKPTTSSTTTIITIPPKPPTTSTLSPTTSATSPTTSKTTAGTTTTPKPTPAPKPPTPIDPVVGQWNVNHTNENVICLLIQFAMQIEIPYNTTSNKTFIAPVNIPKEAISSGICRANTTNVTLEWTVKINDTTNSTDQITFNFVKNATSKTYDLDDIEVSITPDAANFPGAKDVTPLKLHHKHDEFGTSLSKSYRCNKKQSMNFTDNTLQKGTISISHLQFQAFVNATKKEFTIAEDCTPSDTPDVVPIAVGCALAALVIIVLAAYLIGRRRRQARGYLSM